MRLFTLGIIVIGFSSMNSCNNKKVPESEPQKNPARSSITIVPSPGLSEAEKAYISSAGGYLKTLNEKDGDIARAMAGLNSGETTLGDVRAALKKAQSIEDAAWYGDYLKALAPPSFATLDAKILRSRALHESSLKEMLEYWEDGNTAHIASGTKTFQLAVQITNECIADLTAAIKTRKQ